MTHIPTAVQQHPIPATYYRDDDVDKNRVCKESDSIECNNAAAHN